MAAVVSATLAHGACGQRSDPPADVRLAPIVLPDLASLPAPVRQQITVQLATAQPGVLTAPAAARAEQYGRLGSLLLAAEITAPADLAFRHAARLDGTNPRWPYLLGHVGRSSGDLGAAAAAFERALELQPLDEATLVALADVYVDQGRPELAGPLFGRAKAVRSDSVAALVGLGRTALAAGDFAGAAVELEAAIAIDARPSTAHYHLAMAYRGLGQMDRAASHLARSSSMEIGPHDPLMEELNSLLESGKAYQFRGLRALDAGRWSEAADFFRKGLALEPDSPWLLHGLGTARFQMQDPADALEQFDASVRNARTFARGHYSAGVVLAFSGRLAEAVRRFAAAVTVNPQYLEAQLALADTFTDMGRHADALRAYDRALAIDPRAAPAALGASVALLELGRHEEARARLRDGAATYPDRPEFADLLARVVTAEEVTRSTAHN